MGVFKLDMAIVVSGSLLLIDLAKEIISSAHLEDLSLPLRLFAPTCTNMIPILICNINIVSSENLPQLSP